MTEPCSPVAALQERTDIGGIARRATLTRQIRGELKAKGIPVWLVDAGDFSDGTPFSLEYHGAADVAAMNATSYDFATRGDLVALDPFSNTVVTFKITGLQLRKLLKKYTPAVSGVRYRMENGELLEVRVNGKPLQDDRQYTGATNSHFADKVLKGVGVEGQDTGKQRLEVLITYIRHKGTIRPVYDGRRVVIGSAQLKHGVNKAE